MKKRTQILVIVYSLFVVLITGLTACSTSDPARGKNESEK